MTDESTNAAAAMPPYAKREPKHREFHGDVFEDDYEWMRDKDSDDVRSYVAAENQYASVAWRIWRISGIRCLKS